MSLFQMIFKGPSGHDKHPHIKVSGNGVISTTSKHITSSAQAKKIAANFSSGKLITQEG